VVLRLVTTVCVSDVFESFAYRNFISMSHVSRSWVQGQDQGQTHVLIAHVWVVLGLPSTERQSCIACVTVCLTQSVILHD